MTEDPYRWLEAISNRREYIRDQIQGGTPVFALSRPEGILLLGVGTGQSKIFEIYDRHGFGAMGHPVDIEKLRQSAIESAHIEGFNRSTHDVTLRRLISFSLSGTLKASFEQIYSPPLMVESVFAELGATRGEDVLVQVHYDGNHHYETSGILVVCGNRTREEETAAWLKKVLPNNASLAQAVSACLTAWQALTSAQPLTDLAIPARPLLTIEGKQVEAALLDRNLPGPVHYRSFNTAELAK